MKVDNILDSYQFRIEKRYEVRLVGQEVPDSCYVIVFCRYKKRWFCNKFYWSKWRTYGRYRYMYLDSSPAVVVAEEFDNIGEAQLEIDRLRKDLERGSKLFSNLTTRENAILYK